VALFSIFIKSDEKLFYNKNFQTSCGSRKTFINNLLSFTFAYLPTGFQILFFLMFQIRSYKKEMKKKK